MYLNFSFQHIKKPPYRRFIYLPRRKICKYQNKIALQAVVKKDTNGTPKSKLQNVTDRRYLFIIKHPYAFPSLPGWRLLFNKSDNAFYERLVLNKVHNIKYNPRPRGEPEKVFMILHIGVRQYLQADNCS
jgi:hypothetical protein